MGSHQDCWQFFLNQNLFSVLLFLLGGQRCWSFSVGKFWHIPTHLWAIFYFTGLVKTPYSKFRKFARFNSFYAQCSQIVSFSQSLTARFHFIDISFCNLVQLTEHVGKLRQSARTFLFFDNVRQSARGLKLRSYTKHEK